LLAVWAMRGAPHLVPTGDAEVFTAGAMPADEASFAVLLGGRSALPACCWTGGPPPPGAPRSGAGGCG